MDQLELLPGDLGLAFAMSGEYPDRTRHLRLFSNRASTPPPSMPSVPVPLPVNFAPGPRHSPLSQTQSEKEEEDDEEEPEEEAEDNGDDEVEDGDKNNEEDARIEAKKIPTQLMTR